MSPPNRPSLPSTPLTAAPFPSSHFNRSDSIERSGRIVSIELLRSKRFCQIVHPPLPKSIPFLRPNRSDPIEAVQSNRFEWSVSIESPCPRRRCRASELPPQPGPPSQFETASPDQANRTAAWAVRSIRSVWIVSVNAIQSHRRSHRSCSAQVPSAGFVEGPPRRGRFHDFETKKRHFVKNRRSNAEQKGYFVRGGGPSR